MADIVEVVARLGDSIVAVAHGPRVTVGDIGADVFAPIDPRTFAIGVANDDARVANDDAIDAPTSVHAPLSITAGLLTIDVRRVAASSERVPRERSERRPAAYIAVSLLVHLALWGTSMQGHRGGGGLGIRSRYAHVLPARAPSTATAPIDEGELAPGVSMSLDDPHDGIGPAAEIVGHAAVDIVEDRGSRYTRAISAARTAGILGSEALRGEHPLGDIPGTGSPASGFDGRAIEGAARGESAQAAFASERRLRGGCVGEDCGPIGAGRYATLCHGETADAPCPRGGGGYGVTRRHAGLVPTIYMCGSPDGRGPSPCVAVVGDMDKSIIRRYIRRKLPAITGCYEKQLLVDSTVTGTVETAFLIDPTGHVRDITATGMQPEVASCIATVISSIQFPLSNGGGSTQVHYPFSFITTGN